MRFLLTVLKNSNLYYLFDCIYSKYELVSVLLLDVWKWGKSLHLDELPEFSRNVLEVMRQPLEDRIISISRAKYSTEYPASFMLVASMNPCPCGYYGHPKKKCVCNEYQRTHYMSKISGPLLDRIDLQIEVQPVDFDHHIIARHQPHRNLDRPTYLGNNLQ